MNAIRIFVALIGCYIYGLTITYVGGIENALSSQYGMTASVFGSLNNVYLFGSALGLLFFSNMLDGAHAHRLIILLSFMLALSFYLVGMPTHKSFIFSGEFLMGFCATSYLIYTIKLSTTYFSKIIHRLLPLIVGAAILGNASTSIVESFAMHKGFEQTDTMITLFVFLYSFLLWFTVKPFSVVNDSTPKTYSDWVKQLWAVFEPLHSTSVAIVLLSQGIVMGFVSVIFLNIVTPILYINTTYQGTTSLLYLLKGVLGVILGFFFTEKLSTVLHLTYQYGLVCLCSILVALLVYYQAHLFYLTAVLCSLVTVTCTNAANTLHYVTRAVPSSQSAKMAGCAGLIYKVGVFIIGLPVIFMLPQKTTDQISSADLIMISMYFVFLSSLSFALMLYICSKKNSQALKTK
ncbi:MAG: MFS transporter [Pseudomonadota bacterium]|nr:MFS transporter [Pseudomonadota bacterium]